MKAIGIILIVITMMAFFGWVISFSQGKSGIESPAFFIVLILIGLLGFWLIGKSNKK